MSLHEQMLDMQDARKKEHKEWKKKALKALKLAEGIMEYCQGDKWERECTAKSRAEFASLYEGLTRRGE